MSTIHFWGLEPLKRTRRWENCIFWFFSKKWLNQRRSAQWGVWKLYGPSLNRMQSNADQVTCVEKKEKKEKIEKEERNKYFKGEIFFNGKIIFLSFWNNILQWLKWLTSIKIKSMIKIFISYYFMIRKYNNMYKINTDPIK